MRGFMEIRVKMLITIKVIKVIITIKAIKVSRVLVTIIMIRVERMLVIRVWIWRRKRVQYFLSDSN